MSNVVVQSVNDANERSRQNLQPYQSLWLAHWKRAETDCAAAGETSSPNASGNEELDCMSRRDGLTKGLEASSRSPNGLSRVKNGMPEIGNDFIKAGRKRVGKESSKAVHSRSGSPPSGCHSVEEDTSENPPKLVRTCSARKDSLFRLTPLQDRFVDSLPRSFPYKFDVDLDKFDKGKAAVSVSPRKRSIDMRMLEHEHRQTDLLCERKVESLLQSDSSSDEKWGLLLKMQNSSCISLFQSQSSSSEEYETRKSHNDCYSQLKLQKCFHITGTMRICTAVDVPAGFPMFSQSSNDLSMTERADVNASKVDVKASKVTIRSELLSDMKNPHSASNWTSSAKVKCNDSLDECPNADGGNRWVKRLKLSSSNSDFASTSTNERTSKLFTETPERNAKEDLLKKEEEQLGDEGKALSLSHAWIQRLLHSRRIKGKNSEIEGICERESLGKLQKEQLPSVAAMALMAKVLTCFQECLIQKKGSYTVWNTKTV